MLDGDGDRVAGLHLVEEADSWRRSLAGAGELLRQRAELDAESPVASTSMPDWVPSPISPAARQARARRAPADGPPTRTLGAGTGGTSSGSGQT